MIAVESIPGYRPISVNIPEDGDLFLCHGDVEEAYEHRYHEIIVEADSRERGGKEYQVSVHWVPEGYRAVRFGPIAPGEIGLIQDGETRKWDEGESCDDWLVVEPVPKMEIKAPPGFVVVDFRPAETGELFLGSYDSVLPGPTQGSLPIVVHLGLTPARPQLGMQGFFSPSDTSPQTLAGFNSINYKYMAPDGSWSDYFSLVEESYPVKVDPEVPAGWEAVRWDFPEVGECILLSTFSVHKATATNTGLKWLIVRPVEPKIPTEANGQKAWFKEHGEDEWEHEGRVHGIGTDLHGNPFYMDEDLSVWKFCEEV